MKDPEPRKEAHKAHGHSLPCCPAAVPGRMMLPMGGGDKSVGRGDTSVGGGYGTSVVLTLPEGDIHLGSPELTP